MNKDMCVRCGEGVINIRVGAIIIKDDKILMVKNNRREKGNHHDQRGIWSGKVAFFPEFY